MNIVGQAKPDTFAFENSALVKATGFREYNARWWLGHPGSVKEPELNLMGAQALGMGLGTLIRRMGIGPDIVGGHDFRSYSMSIKLALVTGLLAAGARVKDIGLALSPMAYFAQFALDTDKPELVVVESPISPERRRLMFDALDAELRRNPEVGAYNQGF